MVDKLGASHLQFDSQVMLDSARHNPFVISCFSTVMGEVQERQTQLLGFWHRSPHSTCIRYRTNICYCMVFIPDFSVDKSEQGEIAVNKGTVESSHL